MIADPAKPRFPSYLDLPSRLPQVVWHGLRTLSIAGALSLSALLMLAPKTGLFVVWSILVPIGPLLLFLAPGLWRNVCPLAALNQVPRLLGFTRGLSLPNWLNEYGYLIAMGALFVIVPSRIVLFNDDGPSTALLLLGVMFAAFIGGTVFKGKSGWCSNICPMLPVERIYGQTPFIAIRNSHCQTCVGCTRNCYDFNPATAYLADQYDEDRRYVGRRRFFAGAFPGLILAFYSVPHPPAIPIIEMYLRFGLYIIVGAGSFFALDALLKLTPGKLTALYGATALNLYYWFTFPAVIQTWSGALGLSAPPWLAWAARFSILGLTAVWLGRTYRRETYFVAEVLSSIPVRVGSLKASTGNLDRPEQRPVVTIMPGEQRTTIEAGRSLLECIESQGRPIEAGCRMGVCGADPVAILDGMANLSPIGREERSTLERLGLAENTRMACCARIHGAVSASLTIERSAAAEPMTIDFEYDPSVTRVVIVGTGIAGVTAADHIRRRHPSCEIHLVGRERHYLYNRMGISRLIYGRSAMQGLTLLPETWYEQHRITCWINTQAVAVDRATREVRLATGEYLPYDRLILASGSRSCLPAIERFGLAGTFVLRDADDAMKIRAFAQEHQCRHGVVVGGGLLGLEAAYALHKFGIPVSVLERSEALLSRQLDHRGAQILRDFLERIGIEIVLKAQIAAVLGEGQIAELALDKPALKEFLGSRAHGSGRVTQVLLADGRILPCDLLLASIGINPNIELAKEMGLTVNRGVVVDAAMRTSDPNVFAAGDVAEFQQQITGLWPSAVEQAEVAATNAIGGDVSYRSLAPVTMLKVVGIDLISMGQIELESPNDFSIVNEDIVADSEERRYRKLVITDGRIVGAILIGHAIEAPSVTAAIRQRIDVSPILDSLRAGDWQALSQRVRV